MSKVKITLIRSLIDRPQVQKRTVKALGLGRLSSSREHEANPAINGMIRSVAHLLKVEEI